MDEAKVAGIAAKVSYWDSHEPEMGEANVKLRIVQPLLVALGWDPDTGDVEMEYPVQMGSKPSPADYALKIGGRAVVLVETKSFGSGLSERDGLQVLSYGSVEHVRWCVLTNGRELKIFDSMEPRDAKEPNEHLVTSVQLRDLPERLEEVRLISKESVESQETERVVGQRRNLRSAAHRFEESHNEIADAVVRAIRPFLADLPHEELDGIVHKAMGTIEEALKSPTVGQAKSVEVAAPKGTLVRRSVPESQIMVVSRRELGGAPDSLVLVSPAKLVRGLSFLFKYQAWGFVRANEDPRWFALYVGSPQSRILYFGEVERLSPPLATRAEARAQGIDEEDLERSLEPGKRLVWLKEGSLRKLSDPIVARGSATVPYASRYTTMEEFIRAATTADLWGKDSAR